MRKALPGAFFFTFVEDNSVDTFNTGIYIPGLTAFQIKTINRPGFNE